MATVGESLYSFHLNHFTGQVTLQKDQVIKTIYFKKGTPIYVESTIRSETLGQMLMEHGKLTEDQYRVVIDRMQETGKRQGEIIVELGYLSGYEVFQALTTQAMRKLENCFLLEGANIRSEECENQLDGIPELSIDFFRTVLDMIYSSSIPEVEELFPKERAVRVTVPAKEYLAQRSLKPGEAKVVRLLDGKRNVQGILGNCGGDPDEAALFIKTLKAFGFLESVDLPPQRFTMPASAVKKEEEAPPPANEETARRVISIQEETTKPSQSASPVYAWALRMDRPYHELLNLPVDSNKFQAKRNYDAIVRELHLDAAVQKYKEKELEIAEKLFDRLTLALTIWSDDKRRQDYLKNLNARKPSDVPSVEIQAEVCVQKARLLILRKHFDMAEAELRKAMELAPKESAYHVELAECLIHRATSEKKPMSDNIEQELRAALKLNSSDERAFFQLGVLAKVSGDVEKAKGYFNKVISLKPNHAQALAEIRLIQRREGGKKSDSTILSFFKKK